MLLTFQAYLQGPRNYGKDSNTPTVFQINIHDPFSAADLGNSGIDVEAGYVTTFLITPSQIVTSDDFKDLPFYRRKCLFHDETDKPRDKLILFKYPLNYLHFLCNWFTIISYNNLLFTENTLKAIVYLNVN